ncbi:MAG: 30S ribosomal protein S1, partial [Candidatus Fermentibacteraceae bacterium]|nr:30S ribosomal protein S1 [Candidatus Fermentibacteraceae bacterium]
MSEKEELIVGLTAEEIEAIEGQDYSRKQREELEAQYLDNIGSHQIRPGTIVTGKILRRVGNEVIVDINYKSEGIIPISEFGKDEEIVPGDSVDVLIETLEDQDGRVSVSKEKAHFHMVWKDIKDAYDTGSEIKGTIVRRIKGGLKVRIMGVEAFLPGSQVALRQVPNLEQFINKEYDFRVIKLNKRRRNIVVSRRQVLEEARAEQKEALIKELEEEQVRTGIVKNITDFGVFVDLGGIDGLLHITDMSWGRVRHPSHMFSIGDEIEVKILKFDRERERISLGYKQLQPFPWDGVAERYPVDSIATGKVASITDYGAFVELEPGVEGLVHISEMSWTKHIRHPSRVLTVGDEIEVMILNVDEEEKKISLGLKQTLDNPWDSIEERYPVGTEIEGKIRNLTAFGAFVEIEEGIDGLVHISDMSWTRRINHPSDLLKKGDTLKVVVLNIDVENNRISLGLKQTQDNPWDTMDERYPVGKDAQGEVVQLLDRGVVVRLDDYIEGFVPQSQLGWEELEDPAEVIRVGDELPLRVIELEPSSRRIVLSVRSYFNGRPMEELQAFRESLEGREKEPEREPELSASDDYPEGVPADMDWTDPSETREDAEETSASGDTEDTEETPASEETEDAEETSASGDTEDTEETSASGVPEDTEETS